VTCRDNRFNRLAVIGALAAMLALTGCGRKGPLDPPPSASAAERAAAGDPQAGQSAQSGPTMDAQGRPIAPQSGQKKKIFLDWLLD
jgi:predicted small lipoprotein YifL